RGERQHILRTGRPNLDEIALRGLAQVHDLAGTSFGDPHRLAGEPDGRRVARGQLRTEGGQLVVGKCAPHETPVPAGAYVSVCGQSIERACDLVDRPPPTRRRVS